MHTTIYNESIKEKNKNKKKTKSKKNIQLCDVYEEPQMC